MIARSTEPAPSKRGYVGRFSASPAIQKPRSPFRGVAVRAFIFVLLCGELVSQWKAVRCLESGVAAVDGQYSARDVGRFRGRHEKYGVGNFFGSGQAPERDLALAFCPACLGIGPALERCLDDRG